MQALLTMIATVILLAVAVRFVVLIFRGAGILNAGWESAGWLTLALIASVVYASSGDAEINEVADVPQPRVAAETDQQPAAVPRESAEPNGYLRPDSPYQTVQVEFPVQPASTATAQQPAAADRSQEAMSRRELLAELHTATTTKFVNAPGFGFERRLRIEPIETPEKQRLYLPRPVILAGASAAETRVEIPLPDRSSLKSSPLDEDQLKQIRQLMRQRRRGATANDDVENVEPKQVLVVDTVPEWDEWEVSDWELVSILKNDPPVAYASREMRRMHRPRQAATRKLDTLENDALGKLRKGETLVVSHGVNAIRMLGAVRATGKCVKCHAGKKEGDLLGAFSYELHRSQPIAVAARIGK